MPLSLSMPVLGGAVTATYHKIDFTWWDRKASTLNVVFGHYIDAETQSGKSLDQWQKSWRVSEDKDDKVAEFIFEPCGDQHAQIEAKILATLAGKDQKWEGATQVS